MDDFREVNKMPASELPQFNLGAIVSLGAAIVAIIAWLFRMESGVRSTREKNVDLFRDIEKVDLRVEKLEVRHDAINNEMRAMLLGIQKSLATVEAKLSFHSRDRD